MWSPRARIIFSKAWERARGADHTANGRVSLALSVLNTIGGDKRQHADLLRLYESHELHTLHGIEVCTGITLRQHTAVGMHRVTS